MTQTARLKSARDIGLLGVFHIPDSNDVDNVSYNKFSITWSMYTQKPEDSSTFDVSVDQNISYQKIVHWLENYVDQSFWYCPESQGCINAHFASSGNYLFITPDVTINTLANVLMAKFNTLCKDNVFVDSLGLLDYHTGIEYEHEDIEYGKVLSILPTANEFVGEFSIYEYPWWCRDTISSYDMNATSMEEAMNIRKDLDERSAEINADFNKIEKEIYNQMELIYPEEEKKRGQVIELFPSADEKKELDD
jgi:hypothetical protein